MKNSKLRELKKIKIFFLSQFSESLIQNSRATRSKSLECKAKKKKKKKKEDEKIFRSSFPSGIKKGKSIL